MCQHHWQISPPTSPTSIGTCVKCQEQKVFNNRFFDGNDYLIEYRQITPKEREKITEGRRSGILFI
jgi:hypothetical protein